MTRLIVDGFKLASATKSTAFILCLLMPLSGTAFAVEQHVEQFFRSCVGSLPDFSTIAETLEETSYIAGSAENSWIGPEPDSPYISVRNGPDSIVCSLSLIGQHGREFTRQVRETLKDSGWRYEQKSHQGRTIYLVQTELGLTILEVVPPVGASTMLIAHSQKQ